MEIASAESRISEQILWRQNLCKFVFHHLVTSIKPKVLGLKRTKMYVSFLATFHLTDFRENENNMIWSTYLNQQAPRVSVFRIYHIETHGTNIC